VYCLTPVLRGIGGVLSYTTAGANTRRVLGIKGTRAKYAMHRFLAASALKVFLLSSCTAL